MLQTHRLPLPPTLNRSGAIGEYDLDRFAIEYDDETHTIDFRLELGEGISIFAALPAAPNDRLRCFLVDAAAYIVEDPELREDPFTFDSPRLVWTGTLAEYVGGYTLTKVIFESSLAAGAYRFEAHVTDASGNTKITVLTWASPSAPLPVPPSEQHDDEHENEHENERVRDLMRAVYANPRNDDLRVVCADALLEIDDRRGEPSSFEDDAFLSEHRHLLLGGLASTMFIDEVRFQHGFVDRLIFYRANKTPFFHLESGPRRIVSAEHEPKALATVRAIDLSHLPSLDAETGLALKDDGAHRIIARLPQSKMQGLREIVCRKDQLAHVFDHPEQAEVTEWLRARITKLVIVDAGDDLPSVRKQVERYFIYLDEEEEGKASSPGAIYFTRTLATS